MREMGYPVVFDATHSVQLPGGAGTASGLELSASPHTRILERERQIAVDELRDVENGISLEHG